MPLRTHVPLKPVGCLSLKSIVTISQISFGIYIQFSLQGQGLKSVLIMKLITFQLTCAKA